MSMRPVTKVASFAAPFDPGNALTTEEFIAENGQTTFKLSKIPRNGITLFVNGSEQRLLDDFQIQRDVVLWISTDFVLEAGDVIQIEYA